MSNEYYQSSPWSHHCMYVTSTGYLRPPSVPFFPFFTMKYAFPKPIAIICKHISDQLKAIQTEKIPLQPHDQEFLTLLSNHLTTYLSNTHQNACSCFARDIDPDTTLCHCEDRCRTICQNEISNLKSRLQQLQLSQTESLQSMIRATQQRMDGDMVILNQQFKALQDLRLKTLTP